MCACAGRWCLEVCGSESSKSPRVVPDGIQASCPRPRAADTPRITRCITWWISLWITLWIEPGRNALTQVLRGLNSAGPKDRLSVAAVRVSRETSPTVPSEEKQHSKAAISANIARFKRLLRLFLKTNQYTSQPSH